MTPELKDEWTDALRSGEYEQGVGFLECGGLNCCLGVLADILDLPREESAALVYATHEGIRQVSMFGEVDCELSGRISRYNLGPLTRKAIGLPGFFQDELASLNDGGYSFEAIADYIEAML